MCKPSIDYDRANIAHSFYVVSLCAFSSYVNMLRAYIIGSIIYNLLSSLRFI